MGDESNGEPEYWMIPRDSLTLFQWLEHSNYRVDDEHQRISSINMAQVGEITEDGDITVRYNSTNLSSLEDSLKFRSLLDTNKIPYENETEPEEVIKEAKKAAERYLDIAKTVEKLLAE